MRETSFKLCCQTDCLLPEGSLLNTYRVLRNNQSTLFPFFRNGCRGCRLRLRLPVAGMVIITPSSGTNEEKTMRKIKILVSELIADEKELAKHNMLG